LGRAFWFEDARAMLEWRDDDALDALESLSRARLVAEIPSSNGEGFRFTHPMYSELLRGGIMRLKRKRLHAKAATLRAGKAEALEIAEHFLAAEDYSKTLEMAVQAGEKAQMAFAYPQAERAYRMALEAAGHLEAENTASEEQQMLRMQTKHSLGEVLGSVGRIQEAQELWRDVIEHSQWLNNSAELIARVKVDLVKVLRKSGSYESALQMVGEPHLNEPLYVYLCIELAALLRQKNPKQAKKYALDALNTAKQQNDFFAVALALRNLAKTIGTGKRAIFLAQKAVHFAEKTSNIYILGDITNDLGLIYYNSKDRKNAFNAWEKAQKFIEIVNDMYLLATIEGNKALVLMQDLAFAEANVMYLRIAQLFSRMGFYSNEKFAICNRALCLYAENRLLDARIELEKVREHQLESMARVWETRITLELGDGFVLEVPKIEEDAFGYGIYRLTQALVALSFGDYQKAWDLTNSPIRDSDWHWALARVHAGWRLGIEDAVATKKVLLGQADDPALAEEFTQKYTEFIRLVLSEWTPDVKFQLQALLPDYIASPIGIFARDVALSLAND
jgi:tetratricopeptide (TPR) repeat protein